jgi:endonuclease I
MKKFIVTLLTVLIFSLTSCSNVPEETINPLDKVYQELSVPTELESYQLPTEIDGVSISWSSNITNTLSDEFITIQGYVDNDVTLTALLVYNDKSRTRLFEVTILATDQITDSTASFLVNIIDNFVFDYNEISEDIALPISQNNAQITWQSSHPSILSNTGDVTLTNIENEEQVVFLIATFVLDDLAIDKAYRLTVSKVSENITYDGYYLGADGLTGQSLKTFLHDLIDDHTVISYGDLRDALQVSDEDPDNPNNVILLYTGDSVPSTWDGGVTWNREHVWPRSHGDLEDLGGPAFSDMHHLRPTDPGINSSRGNLDFDEGGSLVNNTDDCYRDSDSFEPRDEVKGDIARMIFYMAVRYEGGPGELDLELNESVNNDGPYMGILSILIQWHFEDLPDEFEMNRNDIIYSYQGNRNPFIDHPEFVELIWGSN